MRQDGSALARASPSLQTDTSIVLAAVHIVVTCIVMALLTAFYSVMVHIVMTYIAMAYIVMAYAVMAR